MSVGVYGGACETGKDTLYIYGKDTLYAAGGVTGHARWGGAGYAEVTGYAEPMGYATGRHGQRGVGTRRAIVCRWPAIAGQAAGDAAGREARPT